MKNKIKEHEDVYLHINKENWFIGWRVFWGIILSDVYWLFISSLINNITETDKTFGIGITFGIISMIFFIIGLVSYITVVATHYEEKFK